MKRGDDGAEFNASVAVSSEVSVEIGSKQQVLAVDARQPQSAIACRPSDICRLAFNGP